MKKVLIIGGGVAGMQAAVSLARAGVKPVIVERERQLGGKAASWHLLFPSMTPAGQVVSELKEKVERCGVEVLYSTKVCGISEGGVKLEDGQTLNSDAVIICTGFELFDASIKEEYGYRIYDNVITSADLERMDALRRGETHRRQDAGAHRNTALRGLARRKGGTEPLLKSLLCDGVSRPSN